MSATTEGPAGTQPSVLENYVNGRWTASRLGSWIDAPRSTG
jgi:hypothetical protein